MSQAAATPAPARAPGPLPRTRWQRVRRVLAIGLVMSLILLVIALMVPTWLDTEQGQSFLFSRVNERVHGHVSAASCKLAWFSGISVEGLVISTADHHPVLTCQTLKTDMTLLDLVRANYDLGDTTVAGLTLDLHVKSDGSSDLFDIFARPGSKVNLAAAWRVMTSTVRGVIQVQNSDVRLSRDHAAVRLAPVTARFEIPAHDAIVRCRVRAGGSQNGPPLKGPTFLPGFKNQFAVDAVLPRLAAWPDDPFYCMEDIDVAAQNLPTADWCVLLGLDPAWSRSVGTPADLAFASHRSADGAALVAAGRVSGPDTQAEARTLVEIDPATDRLTCTVPHAPGYYLAATVHPDGPARDLLEYVNPMLATLDPSQGQINLISAQVHIAAAAPLAASADLTISLPRSKLALTGVTRSIISATGPLPAVSSDGLLPLYTPPLLVSVADGRVTCSNFGFLLPDHSALNFLGAVNLDRTLHLLLNWNNPSQNQDNALLGSSSLQIPITGTLDEPRVGSDPRPSPAAPSP